MPSEPDERSFVQISPEIEAIVDGRPPHWESMLLQAALRSTANEINSAYERASTGVGAFGFSDWSRSFINQYEQLLHEFLAAFQNELPAATGQHGKTADSDSILKAVDHLLGIIHDAIVVQQRAVFLSRHPVFGEIAAPLRDIAEPFVDSYNDLLRNLDEQLPTIDQTGRLQLRLNLQSPPALDEFVTVYEQYLKKFSQRGSERRDVVSEGFNIARGTEPLGEFGRSAIVDNLRNGLFRADDWYWSHEHQQWKPLSELQ